MGEGRRSNAFSAFTRKTQKLFTGTLASLVKLYIPYADITLRVNSGISPRLVGNAIINVSSSWGSVWPRVDDAGNPTVDHPWL